MRKRVLIVDDHAPIRRLVRHVLRSFDVEIFEYADADSAWRDMATIRPDVALLDWMMGKGPACSGTGCDITIERIRQP